MPTHTTLKGFDQFGDSLLNQQLKINLVEFFKWGLLTKGAFFNVTIPQSGAYGGVFDRLRLQSVRGVTDGRIWQGARQDWVWESGVGAAGGDPIQVSGVTVDGTFYPLNTVGTYAHTVDYPNGRIIFDSAISTTSVVQAEYTHRWVHMHTSDAPWFKELMFRSFRVDANHFAQSGSGDWDLLADNRIQLPAVVVEPVPRRNFRGKQLGGGQIVKQDVLFHIFAEQEYMRDKLVDIVTYQNNKTIYLFDVNGIDEAGAYPLTVGGSIASGAKTYPDLVNPSGGYFWRKMYFEDMGVQEVSANQPLFRAVVRATVEVNLPQI